jgi:ribonuclease HI
MPKNMKVKPVDLWTDGSSTVTCYIIGEQKPVIQPNSDMGMEVTINVSEYYGVMRALQAAAKQGIKRVTVHADSQLLVRQLTKAPDGKDYIYKTKDIRLQALRRIVIALCARFESVEFKWLSRERNLAGKVLEKRKV